MKKSRLFIFSLLALPFVEIYLFAEIGSAVGGFATLLWVIAGTLLGFLILKYRGLTAMTEHYRLFLRGDDPLGVIAEEVGVLIGAVLLIIPGFFTDFLGILFFLPMFRNLLLARLAARSGFGGGSGSGPRTSSRSDHSTPNAQGSQRRRDEPEVIEGSFRRRR